VGAAHKTRQTSCRLARFRRRRHNGSHGSELRQEPLPGVAKLHEAGQRRRGRKVVLFVSQVVGVHGRRIHLRCFFSVFPVVGLEPICIHVVVDIALNSVYENVRN